MIPFNFFESLKIFLINMVTKLMLSTRLATPGILKKKIIDVIILDYDVIILGLTTKFYLVIQVNL